MWKKRLIRISLLVGVTAITLLGVKGLARRQKNKVAGEAIKIPDFPVEQVVKSMEQEVLGRILGTKKKVDQVNQVNQDNQEEVEPIKQPAENIQSQTQQLIESIKKLPQDQLEAVKKQLLKEFCEQLNE